jgi:hypothetical protein
MNWLSENYEWLFDGVLALQHSLLSAISATGSQHQNAKMDMRR